MFLNSEVFISGSDLRGGQVWLGRLQQELRKADVIIALVTRFSVNNRWVHFEAGAGFVEEKAIPVCADGITPSTLPPPLKFLQARGITKEGLGALAKDIARIAKLRESRDCPGLDTALSKVEDFVNLRATEEPPQVGSTSPGNSSPPTGPSDPDLAVRYRDMSSMFRKHLIKILEDNRERFEIPPTEELNTMNHYALSQICGAYNIPYAQSAGIILAMFEKMGLPDSSASKWTKMNADKRLDSAERDISEIKQGLLGR